MEEKVYLNNEGGEYAGYIVQDLKTPPNMYTPEFGEMYRKFSNRVLWMDGNNVPGAFQMNVAWYYAVPERDPVFEEHCHDSDEIIGFFGCDPEDPYNLHAEIEITINGERHLLTKSTMIFAPAGLPHMRISIKKVDKPVFHFSVVTNHEYIGGAYAK